MSAVETSSRSRPPAGGALPRWLERPAPAGSECWPIVARMANERHYRSSFISAASLRFVASAPSGARRSDSDRDEHTRKMSMPRDTDVLRWAGLEAVGNQSQTGVPRMRIIACQTQNRYGALVMTRITLAVVLLTLALPAIALAQGSHSSGPPAAPSAETE